MRFCRLIALALTPLFAQTVLAQAFPAEFDLSALLTSNGGDGYNGVIINGHVALEFAGNAISPAGDINMDGINDIVIGARSSDQSGVVQSGRVYAVYGSGSPQAEFNLSSLTVAGGGDGSKGFIADGFQFFGRLGQSVATASDFNHDGIDDVILGANGIDLVNPEREGQAYVIYGRASNFVAEFSVESLFAVNGASGEDGLVINAGGATDNMGTGVSSVGDVNADGFDDLLLGAPTANPSSANPLQSTGAAYLLYGSANPYPAEFELASLIEDAGGDGSLGTYFVGAGIGVTDRTGNTVSYIGDINGDGIDDFSIGAPQAGTLQPQGGVYTVFGRQDGFPAQFDLADLLPSNGGDGSEGFFILGSSVEHTASSLCSAGDINNDGLNDLLISGQAIYSDPGPIPSETYAARSYVIYGSNTGFPAQITTGDLLAANGGDGTLGFVMTGEENLGGVYASVCAAGDINHDGVDDIVIGASSESNPTMQSMGRSYVVYGKTGGFSAEVDLTTMLQANGGDGSAGFVVQGLSANDSLGTTVSSAGDFNADGINDLMLSASGVDNDGAFNTGAVYVIFGRSGDDDSDGIANHLDNCLLVSNPLQVDTDSDGFGNICDADFNNDNIVNFLDLNLFRQAFLSSLSLYDLNSDGSVNFLDFALFGTRFLLPPGPSGLGPN